jgi:short-subunit dehydrogenase
MVLGKRSQHLGHSYRDPGVSTAQKKGTSGAWKTATHVCDASDESAIAEVVKRIVGDGRIHILVNSVGMTHVGTLESTSPQDLDLIFRVNVQKLLQQYVRES